MPITRSTAAVATFPASGAAVLNGYSTTTTVARPTMHQKKTSGRGVVTRSGCASAVATSAAPAAASTKPVVWASPYAPSRLGARIGTPNSQRHTSTPTSATRPATIAVATPPDHSWRTSIFGPNQLLLLLLLPGTIGAVMHAHRSPAARASGPLH